MALASRLTGFREQYAEFIRTHNKSIGGSGHGFLKKSVVWDPGSIARTREHKCIEFPQKCLALASFSSAWMFMSYQATAARWSAPLTSTVQHCAMCIRMPR